MDDQNKNDFSVSNPKLHDLYVTYAQEDLKILNEAIEQLSSVSRVDMSILAGMLYNEKARLIKENAAWKEAVWRLEANDLLILEDEIN
jgi:hypothetical protein